MVGGTAGGEERRRKSTVCLLQDTGLIGSRLQSQHVDARATYDAHPPSKPRLAQFPFTVTKLSHML